MSSDAITSQSRSAFIEHYTRCRNILSNADIQLTPTLSLELYSALYVICDFAAYCSNENSNETISHALLSQIIHNLSGSYPGFTTDAMRERVMFYSMVMGDLELHSHALMGKDTSEAHPVVRCCIAFSDCCLYPPYIEDYNAPRPVLSALDVFTFSMEVMQPLNEEFASLYKRICDICSSTLTVAKQTTSIPLENSKLNHPHASQQSRNRISPTKQTKTWDSNKALICAIAIIISIVLFIFIIIIANPSSFGNSSSIDDSTLIEQPRPSNGSIFQFPSSAGVAPFTIKTSGSSDYYIVMQNSHDSSIKVSFYVRGGSTVEIDVPLGNYEVFYAAGDTWYGTEHAFGSETDYYKCDDTFPFTYSSSTGYTGWTLMLYPVSHGNLDTDAINADEFPK